MKQNKTKAKLECRDIRTGVVMNEHSLDAIASPGYYKIEACDVSSSEGFPADVAQGRISAYLEVSVTNRRRDNLKSNTIGQTITLTDGSGTTAMYHRNSINQGGKDVWEQWREVAGSNDLGLVTSLDSYTENGILRGTYTHDTTTEEFVLVVVNNSANGHGGTKRVSQYKYSLHAEGTVSNKVRVARIDGSSTIWGQWVDVAATGTNDIQDASITAAKLADDVRENIELVPDIHNRLAAQESALVNGDIIVGQAREVYSRQGKTDNATFLKRTTAGGTTISDGVASIKQIGGNIVKNLVDGVSITDWITKSDTDISLNNGIITIQSKRTDGKGCLGYKSFTSSSTLVSGHKFYASCFIKSETMPNDLITVGQSNEDNTIRPSFSVCIGNNTLWQYISLCETLPMQTYYSMFAIGDKRTEGIGEIYIKNPLLVDLTEMYGAGKEPTIEECDRMFATMGALPQGLTVAQPTALKSIGYNQWNPANVMPGKCIADSAIVDNAGTSIAIIECLPCKLGAGENNGYVIGYGSGDAWSDSAVEVYLTPLNPMKTEGELYLCRLDKDATHNTYLPGIAGYLLVVTPTTNKLCAHLHWSGDRAATDYEDYVESTVALPQIPQMSEWGLAGIYGNSAYGYLEIEPIRDILDLEKGLYRKNIGRFDLRQMSWQTAFIHSYAWINDGSIIFTRTTDIVDNSTPFYDSSEQSSNVAAKGIVEGSSDNIIVAGGKNYIRDTTNDISFYRYKSYFKTGIVFSTNGWLRSFICSSLYATTVNGADDMRRNKGNNLVAFNGDYRNASYPTTDTMFIRDDSYKTLSEFTSYIKSLPEKDAYVYYRMYTPEEYPIVTKSAPNYIGSDYGVEQFAGSKVPLAANILFYMRSLVSETRNFLDRLMAGLGSDVTAVADKIIAAVNSLTLPEETHNEPVTE